MGKFVLCTDMRTLNGICRLFLATDGKFYRATNAAKSFATLKEARDAAKIDSDWHDLKIYVLNWKTKAIHNPSNNLENKGN